MANKIGHYSLKIGFVALKALRHVLLQIKCFSPAGPLWLDKELNLVLGSFIAQAATRSLQPCRAQKFKDIRSCPWMIL
jgi:hypothetical protein